MTANVKVVQDNTRKIIESMEKLIGRQVLVGIPSETTERGDGEAINNATIGYIQENGAPEVNIPASPHLIPGVEAVEEQAADMLGIAAKSALDGKPEIMEKTLDAIGLIAASSVRSIVVGQVGFEKLADKTLAARRRRGRTGTKRLIDTGEYIKAITYVIRNKGE